ncbi:MAG: hypothetical protein PHI97_13705 [Desulfobulbus sp.]|nr:hypothetical protein [Desulfobulbus sp.]
MIRPCLLLRILALCLPLWLIGCGQSSRMNAVPALATRTVGEQKHSSTTTSQAALSLPGPDAATTSCIDPAVVHDSERNRASCYHLQPARTVVTTQKMVSGGKKPKTKVALKKSHKKKTKAKQGQTRTTVRTVGLCQPQSLIYARCRTGISTCRLGNTSPVQWFACARKNGATASTPVAGSVIVLDTNGRRGMPTGHPAYVEEARKNRDGSWTLRISHTNYDRKCHLALDSKVIFYPCSMTATFAQGPWSPWAKHLKVLGFILR